MSHALAAKRILLVEDDFLIAQMAAAMLAGLGAAVVGPAGKASNGVELVRTEELDAAVLDVNLRSETSEAVADALQDRGIPFVFATGYGEDRKVSTRAPVISKPYTEEKLAAALTRALEEAH